MTLSLMIRWWYLPHFLGLDAAIVAIIWQLLMARSLEIDLSMSTTLALGGAVWMIYLLDRWLDTSPKRIRFHATSRHQFTASYRRRLILLIVILGVTCALLLTRWLDAPVLLGGLSLAVVVSAYLVWVHFFAGPRPPFFSKEVAVGLLFACGVSLFLWVHPNQTWERPIVMTCVFGFLCVMNCIGITLWESGVRSNSSCYQHRAIDRTVYRMAIFFGALGLAIVSLLNPYPRLSPFFISTICSLLGLALLDIFSARLSDEPVRVLADVALLTPIPWLLT